jgi:hypothetical protein
MYILRKRKAADMDFMFGTWLDSWRVSRWSGVVPNHLYYEVHRQLIEDLLARGAFVVLAHQPGNEDALLGFACSELKEGRCVLHYAYIRQGVDPEVKTALIDACPGTKPGWLTHLIPGFRDWRHNPEMARRKSL